MHFSNKPTAALVALVAASGVSATPVTSLNDRAQDRVPHQDIHRVVQHLDKQGHLDWTDHGKGRVAWMNSTLGLEALELLNSQGSGDNKTLANRDTSWTDLPAIFGMQAEGECWGSGPQISNGWVLNGIGSACDALDKAFTGGAVGVTLNAGAFIYDVYGSKSIQGEDVSFFYTAMNLVSAVSTPMSAASCSDAMHKLLESKCGGGGNAAGWTYGGLANVVNEWAAGFDVNWP